MRFCVLAVLCLFSVSAQVKSKSAFDKAAMETSVRHLLLIDPRVTVNIDDPKPGPMAGVKEVDVHLSFQGRSQDEIFYVSNDGQHVLYGRAFDITQSPFQEELAKIHTDGAPSFGPPNAPVTIVLYSDFECPACKEEAKTLRDNLAKAYPTQVRVYFRDFPLDQIHPWARTAAIAGRCFYRQNPQTFWDFYDWIYEHQADVTPANVNDKLAEFAKEKNVDALQYSRCTDNKSTEPDIDKSVAEGKSLKIDQTPTMFINGRRIPGAVPWDNLKMIIDGELAYAQPADDKCCEVKIPSALNK